MSAVVIVKEEGLEHYLSAEDIADVLRREGDITISGRTVHYYAEQRLLPPPEYHGSRPRYTDTHLVAMRHARDLKRHGYTSGCDRYDGRNVRFDV